MKWLLVLAVAACGPRSPHEVTAAFVGAVDRMDVDAALKLVVSPEQVGQIIECPQNTEAAWFTTAGRAERVAKMRASYAAHRPGQSVKLGDLWEEYDRPSQWHDYKPGDDVGIRACRAKAGFEVANYRIQLEFPDAPFGPKLSTKPIELWRIDGAWYVWDDPLDTEGW
jgi:hypothetical protein